MSILFVQMYMGMSLMSDFRLCMVQDCQWNMSLDDNILTVSIACHGQLVCKFSEVF